MKSIYPPPTRQFVLCLSAIYPFRELSFRFYNFLNWLCGKAVSLLFRVDLAPVNNPGGGYASWMVGFDGCGRYPLSVCIKVMIQARVARVGGLVGSQPRHLVCAFVSAWSQSPKFGIRARFRSEAGGPTPAFGSLVDILAQPSAVSVSFPWPSHWSGSSRRSSFCRSLLCGAPVRPSKGRTCKIKSKSKSKSNYLCKDLSPIKPELKKAGGATQKKH